MVDVLGYAASIAVLVTFLMQSMLTLRSVAILSNILFLLYGYYAHIPPVIFLHATLLPINVARLIGLRERANPRKCDAGRQLGAIIGSRFGFRAKMPLEERKLVVVAEPEQQLPALASSPAIPENSHRLVGDAAGFQRAGMRICLHPTRPE
jgi:hypothetical protein